MKLNKPSLELRLSVIAAVDYAQGNSIRERIKHVSGRTFTDPLSDLQYRFTWRTISTWLYRFKKRGITSVDNKTRSDKNSYRKVQANELAEAINEVLPNLKFNKTGVIPKSCIYRYLLKSSLFQRSQLSQTSFYRMVKENNLLNNESNKKTRRSFAMQFSNEMWQADTMYGVRHEVA
jgi:putative transposase